MPEQAGERESKHGPGLERFLDLGEHPVHAEVPTTQVRLLRRHDVELTALLGCRHIDAGATQLVEILRSLLGWEDMVGALTALEAVAHERQQRRVLRSGRCVSRVLDS